MVSAFLAAAIAREVLMFDDPKFVAVIESETNLNSSDAQCNTEKVER
jgi:hypothetical protein